MQMNGYGHINVYPANVGQRRGSADSTIANFGNDEDLPPAYEDGDVEYGRIPIDDGKDITMNGGGESPPAHEIRLDNEDVQHSSGGDKGGVEMIEKTHEVPSTLYRFGNDGSKTAKTENDDAMTGITAQEEEVDLIDFKD